MKALHVNIRPIGNSLGIVIPKPLLLQAGLQNGEAEMSIENGALVLRKPTRPARQGWAEAAARLAAQGGDQLVMGEFSNESDAELKW